MLHVLQQTFANMEQRQSTLQDYAEHVAEEEDGQEYNAVNDDEDPQIDRDTFVSKNGKMGEYSITYRINPRQLSQLNSPRLFHNVVSKFLSFFARHIERVVVDVTNRQGYSKRRDEWKATRATNYAEHVAEEEDGQE